MKPSFISELEGIGRLILFGSVTQRTATSSSDIDIAVVVPDGLLRKAKSEIECAIRKRDLSHVCLIQHLFAYTKSGGAVGKSQFLHILICEQNDLQKKHPILSSLEKGVELSFKNAA